jgi:hypothetical protein
MYLSAFVTVIGMLSFFCKSIRGLQVN